MPLGKPAGMACVNLDPQTGLCGLWGSPEYPPTCHSFQPEPAVCGTDRAEAIILITRMEQDTLS